jgi:SAM-dependent methyltransferase
MSARTPLPMEQHNVEIARNREAWRRKPLLRKVYKDFHRLIAGYVDRSVDGIIVEVGSGIGNIREVIPDCMRTDLFPNPWIDQVENVYALSFADASVSHIILFDVFHHLRHPRTALLECRRALMPGGRVIIFDPYVSLLGRLVYGPLHHEPIAWDQRIVPDAPRSFAADRDPYYAAQGNATRVFWRDEYPSILKGWELLARRRIGAWPYALTGGYSKPQLYPSSLYEPLKYLDKLIAKVPSVTALRTLIVLRKPR